LPTRTPFCSTSKRSLEVGASPFPTSKVSQRKRRSRNVSPLPPRAAKR
jgi:hypothetical protein